MDPKLDFFCTNFFHTPIEKQNKAFARRIHALLLARTCILSAVGVVFGIYVSLEVVGAMVSNFEFGDVYLLSRLCVLADSVLGFV